jgi:hypothetical protein
MSPARVVKLVDTRDLKSLDRKVVPVRFRPRAPKNSWSFLNIQSLFKIGSALFSKALIIKLRVWLFNRYFLWCSGIL